MNNNSDFLIHRAIKRAGFKEYKRCNYIKARGKKEHNSYCFSRGSLGLYLYKGSDYFILRVFLTEFGENRKTLAVMRTPFECLCMSEEDLLYHKLNNTFESGRYSAELLLIDYPRLCKLIRDMK
jgi:hypothetical protein